MRRKNKKKKREKLFHSSQCLFKSMTELRALREWSLFIGRGGGGRGVSEDFGVSQLNSSDPSLRLFRILVTPPLW